MADLVNLTIDGKKVTVAKGTNLIEAAKTIGVEIPHYCYHPHLSIAGNCRMCQVEVKGRPKLEIGCNCGALEGMEVSTQNTSKKVEDAQAATLEFILVNHPLDCTVCDQAGHCKLQDYHYEYNARSSRFLEDKEHKVKATPLGPTVILDGERCIMCTRCIRFCDEVTQTSELGMLNRGDRSVIAVQDGHPLNNPLSGTVVDLCPVGALTHREWRFNTRIWFTKETDSICPGCSTGCNVKVAVRDGKVVQVKARLNAEVNKEWLCDEGRYGFNRFLPEERVAAPTISKKIVSLDEAVKPLKGLRGADTVVFLSPTLMLEEYWLIKNYIERDLKGAVCAVGYKSRTLSKVEAILISPDYAANYRGAELAGLIGTDPEGSYKDAVTKLKSGAFKNILVFGEGAIVKGDINVEVLAAFSKAALSVALLTDAQSEIAEASKIVIPVRSVLEKSGLMVNGKKRVQYADAVIDFPVGTHPEWRVINLISGLNGPKLVSALSDRDLTVAFLGADKHFSGLKISGIKGGGVTLNGAGSNGQSAASGSSSSAGV